MHMFLASELSRIHNVSGILTADHMCKTRWHVKSTSLVPSFCKALKDRPVTQVSLIELSMVSLFLLVIPHLLRQPLSQLSSSYFPRLCAQSKLQVVQAICKLKAAQL